MAEQLQVRAFEEGDGQAVVALWNEVFADDPPRNDPATVVRRKLEVQRDLFLVGIHGGCLVATVMAGFDGYRGWVYHLAVAPRLRRRGFGRQMMQAAEVKLRANGCPKVNLQVCATNRSVIDFYKTLGYAIEDRVSMGKQLD